MKLMNQIIVITGASSGFGALTARALADTGNTVYAGMRATDGRNAPQVQAAADYSNENGVDLRAIEMDVNSADDGSEEVSEVADRIRREFLTRIDLADLLTPSH